MGLSQKEWREPPPLRGGRVRGEKEPALTHGHPPKPAKGMELKEAVRRAKNYISGALAAGLNLGKGSGPMDHGFAIEGEYPVTPR